jgi:ATP-binding cassette subfamily B (MDR/TAP) protein 1
MNRTLLKRAHYMLSQAGLSNHFWAKKVNVTYYLVNRSPSIILELKAPYEVRSTSPTDYSKLRVFGCPAYAHVKEIKLKPRARKYIFLGYASRVKGY